MARHCPTCGRPLDKTGHDIEGTRLVPDRKWGFRRVRNYVCRVRLIARQTAPLLDKQGRMTKQRKVVTEYVPDSPQRTRQNLAAFVPIAVLETRKGD